MKSPQKFNRLELIGLVLFVISYGSLFFPSSPSLDSRNVFANIVFYAFIASSLTSPFVLRKAYKAGKVALVRWAFYLSWLPFVLALLFLATLPFIL